MHVMGRGIYATDENKFLAMKLLCRGQLVAPLTKKELRKKKRNYNLVDVLSTTQVPTRTPK